MMMLSNEKIIFGSSEFVMKVSPTFRDFIVQYAPSSASLVRFGFPESETPLAPDGYSSLQYLATLKLMNHNERLECVVISPFGIGGHDMLAANHYIIKDCYGFSIEFLIEVKRLLVDKFAPKAVSIQTDLDHLVKWARSLRFTTMPSWDCDVTIFVERLGLHYEQDAAGFNSCFEILFEKEVRNVLLMLFGRCIKLVVTVSDHYIYLRRGLKLTGMQDVEIELLMDSFTCSGCADTCESCSESVINSKKVVFAKRMRAIIKKLHKFYDKALYIDFVDET